MNIYKPVPLKTIIPYPVLLEIYAYTENYRLNFMDRENPDKGWHKFFHSSLLQVLVIGGMNDYFVIYSYPPAGIVIANPEEVLDFELWRGWILELVNYKPTYRLDTATYREGEAAFKSRKTELGY